MTSPKIFLNAIRPKTYDKVKTRESTCGTCGEAFVVTGRRGRLALTCERCKQERREEYWNPLFRRTGSMDHPRQDLDAGRPRLKVTWDDTDVIVIVGTHVYRAPTLEAAMYAMWEGEK